MARKIAKPFKPLFTAKMREKGRIDKTAPEILDSKLIDAVRDGRASDADKLLQKGANPNARALSSKTTDMHTRSSRLHIALPHSQSQACLAARKLPSF